MSHNIADKILLVGAGPMAVDYCKVMVAQHLPFTIIGRGEESARVFAEKTGVQPLTGGVEVFLKNNPGKKFKKAIVAVGVEALMETALILIEAGVQEILLEKPGGLNYEQIAEVSNAAVANGTKILMAYNRRFYASVNKAKEIIEEDGGVTSFHFEFTEWSHKIGPLKKHPAVKENWFLANSSHVVDLAFYLGGLPIDWSAYTASGKLDWHKPSNFAGAGITDKNALFTYQANWEAPGRWGIEFLTKQHRLILRSLETLSIQKLGSIDILPVDLDSTLDTHFKPGLYNQVVAFIKNEDEKFIDINTQLDNVKKIYSSILSGK